MAQVEVCERLHFRLSDESEEAPVATILRSTLPLNFFNYSHAVRYFNMGSPEHQLGGLVNIGYNCYINAVIQCLAYTPGFAKFCTSMPNILYQANADSAFFLDSLAHIFSEMETSRSGSPAWILTDSGLIRETFRRPIQQDAHEYLLDLLNVLESECQRAMAKGSCETIISHFFCGEMAINFECHRCGSCANHRSRYHDIEVPISEYEDLSSAIAAMTNRTEVVASSQCEHCGVDGDVTKSCTFVTFPLILVITLMRFDNACKKIEDFFPFPKTLIVGDGQEYTLYAMILHDGRLISHGHFVAYVMDQHENWYKADDVCIYRLKEEAVMSSCPYVLFYKRVNVYLRGILSSPQSSTVHRESVLPLAVPCLSSSLTTSIPSITRPNTT